MKILSWKHLLLTAVGILFSIVTFSQKTITLKVMETSDVHGAIFPFDFIGNKPMGSSLAQVYTIVRNERSKMGQNLILLDNGDILQGQPTVYYSNFIDSLGQNIVSRVFNYMGYNAATVGNHDIETGPSVYRKVEKEFNFPWLSANATSTIDGKPTFVPYTILIRDGIRVAILGLTTPGIPNWLPTNLWPNMHFDDMIVSTKYWVNYIQQNEKPDVIIGLFHAGYNPTYGGGDANTPLNENASLLVAEQVPGFDLILIGHDHDRFCKRIANNLGDSVLVMDPMSSARLVSEATIQLNVDGQGKITRKTVNGDLIDTKNFEADSAFMSNFKTDYQNVLSFVSRKIGEFTETTSSTDAYFGPSTFIDFIHSAQLDLSKADISFAAPLSFVSTIKEGTVTVSDMFKLYRFENFLYTIKLTGSEIDKYLEYTASLWFNTMTSDQDHLIRFKLNPDGSIVTNRQGSVQLFTNYYNFDSAAGIIYTIDVTKPDGDKVTIKSMADGSPFDMNKVYTVAINSYRGNGGGGHLTKGCGLSSDEIQKRIVSSTEKDLRYYIMKYIEQKQVITPKSFNTWNIIPENWVKEASERDRKILFKSDRND